MFKSSSIWMKKLGSITALVALLLPSLALAEVAPVIANAYANPAPFNPANGQLDVHFELNTQAYATVDIMQNGSSVKTLVSSTYLQSGAHDYYWDGANAAAGTYQFSIYVFNTVDSQIFQAPFTVSFNNQPPQGSAPVLSGLSASPNPFDPNSTSTTISYSLDKPATVTVQIFDSTNNLIRTLSMNGQVGFNPISWDGRYTPNGQILGAIVPQGPYSYRVTASNNFGPTAQTGFVTVTYANQPPQGSAPVLSGLSASPNPFDPNSTSTTLYYTLDKSATVTIQISDSNNSTVRTLAMNGTAGVNQMNWDGRYTASGSIVPQDTYTYRITASNAFGPITQSGTVIVSYYGGTQGSAPNITNDYAIPNPFDPNTGSTTIYYTLDKAANVTVQVLDSNNSTIQTLYTNTSKGSGVNFATWDGSGSGYNSQNYFNQSYTYRITATSNGLTNTKSGTVTISSNGGGVYNNNGNLIQNLTVTPGVFDPNNQQSTVYFNLTQTATVTVEILDRNGSLIRTLVDRINRSPTNNSNNYYTNYSYADSWNGRYIYGGVVPDGLYQFRVRANATNSNLSDSQTAYVQVSANGGVIPFPQICGSFIDVSVNSPYCKAIQQMQQLGIFNGYTDGTFRPDQRINRAEATKVILLALNIPVTNINNNYYGYSTFSDVTTNSWYAPYIREAQARGIVRGYPDRTFKPNQTINRVELLKIFLQASGITMPACSTAPYIDTLRTGDTFWYLNYVCFAKAYGLMYDDGTGKFNPMMAMTRGDVADLFYQFQLRGLSSQVRIPVANYNNLNSNYYYNNNNYYYGTSNSQAINIINSSFSPNTITVARGSKVTWTDRDSMMSHTVSSDFFPYTLNSGALKNGDTYSYTFTQPGTYYYHCSFHLNMRGTIIVN